MKAITFSICILTMNQLEMTKRCLTSLMDTYFRELTEIIIVDNASVDGTREWLIDFQNKYNLHLKQRSQ